MSLLSSLARFGATDPSLFDELTPEMTEVLLWTVAVFVVIGLVLLVFFSIVLWKMFVKAGMPGWKAIIPFYNMYITTKLGGLSEQIFWWYLVAAIAAYSPLIFLPLIGSLPVMAAGTLALIIFVYFLMRFEHPNYVVFVILFFLFTPACLFMMKDLRYKGAIKATMPHYAAPAAPAPPSTAPSATAKDSGDTPLV